MPALRESVSFAVWTLLWVQSRLIVTMGAKPMIGGEHTVLRERQAPVWKERSLRCQPSRGTIAQNDAVDGRHTAPTTHGKSVLRFEISNTASKLVVFPVRFQLVLHQPA